MPTENKISDDISFKSTRILVVDDNKLNLKIIDKIVKRYGIDTEKAGREIYFTDAIFCTMFRANRRL